MVAMGSSFADGAWDRESAVYRISGVVTVIAGWFLTGISAFTFACFINFILCNLGFYAALVLIPCVYALIIYTNFIRKSKSETANSLLKAKNDVEIAEDNKSAYSKLSLREQQILKLLIDGVPIKDIAAIWTCPLPNGRS